VAEAQRETAEAMEMPELELPSDMPLEEVTSADLAGGMPGGAMAAAAAEEEALPAGEMPVGEVAVGEETGEMPAGEMPVGEMGEGEESGKASVIDMSGTWRLELTVNSVSGSPKA
jgi:hypothetical protein